MWCVVRADIHRPHQWDTVGRANKSLQNYFPKPTEVRVLNIDWSTTYGGSYGGSYGVARRGRMGGRTGRTGGVVKSEKIAMVIYRGDIF